MEQQGMQQRVQLVVLAQIAAHQGVDPARVADACPYADERDLARALEILVDEGSVDRPGGSTERLPQIAASGLLQLTRAGQQRVFDAAQCQPVAT
jgi:hypothetical protein